MAVYNRVSEQRLVEEQHQQAAGEVRNSWQASGQRQMQCAYWWKRWHSWIAVVESGRQISEPPYSQRNFMWGRGSVSQIIHKDLHLKCCKKSRAQQLTEAHSMHALFSVCSLRDYNVITKTYTKTETCKLYSRVFWIFLPNIIKTDPYNFELYRFKVGSFFYTQCSRVKRLC